MNERVILILCFAAGVLAQSVILMRNDQNWGKLGICVAVGFMGFFPGKHEYNYQPLFHTFMALAVFAVVFALTFKDDILPMITEKVLLSYSLIFWFSFFSFFYRDFLIHKILFCIFLLPSLATLFIVFVKSKLNFWGKLFFYSWFLIIIIALGLFKFSFSHLSLFFDTNHTPWIGTLDCTLTGMAFLYLVVNATYIWELIPIQGKNQSWENRMKEWHDLTNLMTQRCDDQQPTHRVTMAIIVLQGGGLFLDYIYHWIPAQILINFLILLPVFVSSGKSTAKSALQSSSALLAKDL